MRPRAFFYCTNRRTLAPLLAAVGVGLTLAAAPPSAGQEFSFSGHSGGHYSTMGHGRFANLLRPDFTRRDLPIMIEDLELEDMHRSVLQMLFDDYTEKFSHAAKQFTDVRDRYEWPTQQIRFAGGEVGDRMANVVLEGFDGSIQTGSFVMIDSADVHFGDIHTAGGGGGGEGGEEMSFNIAIMVADDDEHADLSEEQIEGIHIRLTEGLEERLKERRAELTDILAAIEEREAREAEEDEEKDIATADEVLGAARTLLAEKTRLHEELIGDVELLIGEKFDAWPAVDRKLRRVNTLPHGQLSTESLDLHRLANQADAAGALGEILAKYDESLNEALRTRNDTLVQADIENFKASADEDHQRQLDIARQTAETRLGVRRVNDEFVEAAANELDEILGQTVRQRAREEAFPAVYRRTRAERAMAEALEIADLDPDVADAIGALQASYAEELPIMQERMIQIIRADEVDRSTRMMEMMRKMRAGEMDFSKIELPKMAQAFEARTTLSRRYLDQLEALLTSEQFEGLRSARRALFEFRLPTDGG